MIPHWLPGMVAHTHDTEDEAHACEAELADLRARLDTYAA